MAERIMALAVLALLLPSIAAPWQLTPSVSYGACFLEGAPNAYIGFPPPPKTNEPLAAALAFGAGRWRGSFSYAHRYELYSHLGKVHDFALVAAGAPLYSERWAVFGEAGVAVARAPVYYAFVFEDGHTVDWTPVVGVSVAGRPWSPLVIKAGVSYRERLQVINFFEYTPFYGAVKSPAIDLTADALFYPWPFVGLGPSVRQIFYGPYDYYYYAQTERNEGWVTGKEFYVMASLAVEVGEVW